MSLSSRLRVSKDEVVAENGVVTANHPLSAEAGLEMLKKGGNAVDAAVATGFTACVVEPMMTTIGGCGFMLVHLAQEGKSVVIEFSPRAPRAAGPEMYTVEDSAILDIGLQSVANSENIIGPKSASVPGTIAGFCMAHKKYGSLPLEQVMEPAIHHAEQGFEVDWYTAVSIADEMERLVRYPGISGLLLNGGFPPTVGSRLVQRDLGQTLRAVAKSGAKAFYLGDIADAIASDVQASGGILSREDLENYRAEEVEPVSITYRGHTVLAARAVNGGTTALETLSVLNNLDIGARGHNSAEALHLFIEATRHAFADRYWFLGDPEFVSIPLRGLLSAGYGAALAAEMDRVNARLEPEGDTPPWLAYADTAIHDPWAFDPGEEGEKNGMSGPSPKSSTTHLSVIDKDRNMVSCTHTVVNSFGSMIACRGTGVILADGMLWFNPGPGRANSISGWKRPLVNMAPVLVLKDGRPLMTVGAPGGRKIINAVTQVVMNVVDFGMGMQDAIAAPRVDASGLDTMYSQALDPETVDGLRARGHRMAVGPEDYANHSFARPVGVLIDEESGRLRGGADVLRRAEAKGY